MPAPPPNPTIQPPASARILRYLLWASELGLVLTLLYVMATKGPAKPAASPSIPAASPALPAASAMP